MDIRNDFPGYESFDSFVDPTFEASSTLSNNNNNSFTTVTDHFYDIDIAPHTMSQLPVTPSSRSSGRGMYPHTVGNYVTPHSQQYNPLANYPSSHHGMSLSQTPMPATMLFGQASAMHAPMQAVPTFNVHSYNGSTRSFSDSSDTLAAVSTPTPKARGMPTPTQSPQSPQGEEGDLPTVPLSDLKYDTYKEAEAEATGRYSLRVDNDDWKAVEADKKVHVAAIMAQFDVEFKAVPNVPLNDSEKRRWVKYQTEQNDKVNKYLAKFPRAKELSAWMLLEALIDGHKLGIKKSFRVSDMTRCCSMRFEDVSFKSRISNCSANFQQMVKAIGNYAVIRFDLVRMQRLDDLASSPSHCVSRKVANWRGNAGKVKRDEANKKFAAAAGVTYKNVLGAKRKYKPLESAADEFDEQVDEDDVVSSIESPLSGQQSKKRKASDEDGAFIPTSMTSPYLLNTQHC